MQRNPWAFRGYSDELIKAWKKDRPRFLAEVEKRRQQYKDWAASKAGQSTPGDAGASQQANSGMVNNQGNNGG